jgi:hypothetical protein
MLLYRGDAGGNIRESKAKRPITKIKQHAEVYRTPKILRITEYLGSFYGRRRHSCKTRLFLGHWDIDLEEGG